MTSRLASAVKEKKSCYVQISSKFDWRFSVILLILIRSEGSPKIEPWGTQVCQPNLNTGHIKQHVVSYYLGSLNKLPETPLRFFDNSLVPLLPNISLLKYTLEVLKVH